MGDIMKINDSCLSALGDAIRAKNGSNSKYRTRDEMPAAIRALIWHGTQAEYDLIDPKNPNILYIIESE